MPVQPKSSTAATQQQRPSGKDTRKVSTAVCSGTSPCLPKRTLGHISLNSPRATQRVILSSHKNKPPAGQVVGSPLEHKTSPLASPSNEDADASIESSTATATESGSTSDAVATAAVASSSDENMAVTESSAIVLDLEAKDNAPEKGQEDYVSGVRGRPSMMVVTANPRLEEVTTLPRGTVVRVKLFAEDNEEQETVEEEQRAQNVAETIEEEEETNADPPDTSVVKEDIMQQQEDGADDAKEEDQPGLNEPQQQEETTADPRAVSVVQEDTVLHQQGANNVTEEAQPGSVEPRQQEEQSASVKRQHHITEAQALATTACEDIVGASRVATSTEPAHTEKQQTVTPMPPLLSEEEQDKGVQQGEKMAGLLIEERQDGQQGQEQDEGEADSVPLGGEGVSMVKETATVAVGATEQHEDERVGVHPTSSSQKEDGDDDEDNKVLLVPAPEKDDNAGVARVSQPEDVVAVTGNGPEAAGVVVMAAKHEMAVEDSRSEGEGLTDVVQRSNLLVDLVEGSKYLQFEDDERIVLCTLTGKKMAPVYDNIILYIGCRKVQRLMVEGPFIMSVSMSI